MEVRDATSADHDQIFTVVEQAFLNAPHTNHKEQFLVNLIRESPEYIPKLDIVAVKDHKIVGHIILTKTLINKQYETLLLGPIAVLPDYQKQGVGKALIMETHKRAVELGFKSIVLVGHADYYPKFGYRKLSEFNIKMPFPLPDENVLGIELVENAFKGVEGVVEYPSAFNKLSSL